MMGKGGCRGRVPRVLFPSRAVIELSYISRRAKSRTGPGWRTLRSSCVRTMLGLEAVGVLDKITSFAEQQVAPELLDAFSITIRHREHFYQELLEPLKACGRGDLAVIIEKKLSKSSP